MPARSALCRLSVPNSSQRSPGRAWGLSFVGLSAPREEEALKVVSLQSCIPREPLGVVDVVCSWYVQLARAPPDLDGLLVLFISLRLSLLFSGVDTGQAVLKSTHPCSSNLILPSRPVPFRRPVPSRPRP